MPAENNLPALEIATGADPEAAVIWLHGLGADGHDFEPIVDELHLSARPSIRFVFPHAPVRPVTLNAGMAMRAWFDIHGLDVDAPEDRDGVGEASAAVARLIARERERGVVGKKIALAGFSQGGAVALHAGLDHAGPLAGIMALSSWLPHAALPVVEVYENPASLPIFMGHGGQDPVVQPAIAELSRDQLVNRGFRVEWHAYPMGHAVCAEEIQDIRKWLLKVLA